MYGVTMSFKIILVILQELCVHHGSHLVNIGSAVENTFLKSYLSDLNEPKHWIGLRDEAIEGIWTWYDTDMTASFINWAPGQPNEGKSANCGAIWGSFGYNWVDEPCTHQFKPICEKRNEKAACSEVVG